MPRVKKPITKSSTRAYCLYRLQPLQLPRQHRAGGHIVQAARFQNLLALPQCLYSRSTDRKSKERQASLTLSPYLAPMTCLASRADQSLSQFPKSDMDPTVPRSGHNPLYVLGCRSWHIRSHRGNSQDGWGKQSQTILGAQHIPRCTAVPRVHGSMHALMGQRKGELTDRFLRDKCQTGFERQSVPIACSRALHAWHYWSICVICR